MSVGERALPGEQAEFLEELRAAGLLIQSRVPGVYGRGEVFERIREGLTKLVSDLAATEGATRWRFPPIAPRWDLETTGYVGNFPHLAGSIFGFHGSEADGLELGERAAVHEDWGEFQRQTELMLLPAACYPVYPALAAQGPLDSNGAVIDIGAGWVFRHEPSGDPARLQAFRVHELIRAGSPEVVARWRSQWAQLSVGLFGELGLEAQLANASDPFFGRHGRLMAASQSAEQLKLELLVQIAGSEPTACASFNCHLDHFSAPYGLRQADGATAHSACAGFGQERIVLALLRAHGLDVEQWPLSVRARLWDRP